VAARHVGLAISNSELIRTVHNGMARPESLLPDEDKDEHKAQMDEDCLSFLGCPFAWFWACLHICLSICELAVLAKHALPQ
jgi:hypothetical protein